MSDGQPSRRDFMVQAAGALTAYAVVPDLAGATSPVPTPPLKVGLIGAGRQGRAIVAELQKMAGVELCAVCDTVAGRLDAMLGRVKGAEGFADHRALLGQRPDVAALVVATPTHLHRAIVDDALGAGRHVYCESPLASTVDDCRAIAAAASRATTVCQAGFQGRSNPTYKRAQTLVRSELRDLVSIEARSHRKTSWRFPSSDPSLERLVNWRLDPDVSTGLAGEVAAQQLDVAHWFSGTYPVRIEGRGEIRHHKDGRTVPDTIDLHLRWADGLALQYHATLANSYGAQTETFYGVNGTIRLAWTHGWLFKEPDAPTQGWEVYATRQQHFNSEGIVLIANATQLAAQGDLKAGIGLPHPSLYYALEDFVRSATTGAPVACSAEEGARASIIGILANQAVIGRAPVDVPVFG